MHFNGPAYDQERDGERLSKQHEAVKSLMSDGEWRTLRDISEELNYPEASVSAQLRHLRKKRFGSHTVERRYVGGGLYEYKVLQPDAESVIA